MKYFSLFLLITSLLTSFTVSAGSKESSDDITRLKLALAKSMPNVQPSKISTSPVTGLYEVIVGSQVVYMSIDARFMIEGDLIDLKTKTNVTEDAKSSIRLTAIDQLGADNMLVYKPKKVKDTITVITDINCTYCRRLHSEIPVYLKNDVEVRYVFMSERGSGSGMKKTISVWCSDNQQQALDEAKAGGEIKEKTCKNPIRQHLALARELGVRGTPAIILEDGQLLPGYVPANKLIAEIRK